MALSYSDIMGIWIKAGGSAAAAPVAAAVAMAESGGNPNAHNAKPPDDSYGLWQINMIGSMGPARRAQFGISSNSALFDPLTNARAAVKISNGGASWSPWTTFTSGAYKKYLNGSTTPNLNVGGATGDTATTAASVSDNIINSIFEKFYPLVNTVGNLTTFAGEVVLGGLVIAAGLYLLFRETGGATAVSAAGGAFRAVTPGLKVQPRSAGRRTPPVAGVSARRPSRSAPPPPKSENAPKNESPSDVGTKKAS